VKGFSIVIVGNVGSCESVVIVEDPFILFRNQLASTYSYESARAERKTNGKSFPISIRQKKEEQSDGDAQIRSVRETTLCNEPFALLHPVPDTAICALCK
jgi:hypothetical protein